MTVVATLENIALSKIESTLKEKNLLLKEQILNINSRHPLRRETKK